LFIRRAETRQADLLSVFVSFDKFANDAHIRFAFCSLGINSPVSGAVD
jgi:hypothetical protein